MKKFINFRLNKLWTALLEAKEFLEQLMTIKKLHTCLFINTDPEIWDEKPQKLKEKKNIFKKSQKIPIILLKTCFDPFVPKPLSYQLTRSLEVQHMFALAHLALLQTDWHRPPSHTPKKRLRDAQWETGLCASFKTQTHGPNSGLWIAVLALFNWLKIFARTGMYDPVFDSVAQFNVSTASSESTGCKMYLRTSCTRKTESYWRNVFEDSALPNRQFALNFTSALPIRLVRRRQKHCQCIFHGAVSLLSSTSRTGFWAKVFPLKGIQKRAEVSSSTVLE